MNNPNKNKINLSYKIFLTFFLLISICIFPQNNEKEGFISLPEYCQNNNIKLNIVLSKKEIVLTDENNNFLRIDLINKIGLLNNKNIINFQKNLNINSNGIYEISENFLDKIFNNQKEITKKEQPFSKIDYVFLDAGHGGKDSGYKNNELNILEKDINLQITKLVYDELKKLNKEIKIIMIRDSDVYIHPKARSDKASSIMGDKKLGIFICIHSNATVTPKIQGVETFYFNPGLSNNVKSITEFRENRFYQKYSKEITEYEGVNKIISKIVNFKIVKESQKLAEFLHWEIIGKVQNYTQDRGIKPANFWVLSFIDMPSVLIEMGFLSNNEEARRLSNKKYQLTLAKCFAQGINNFVIFFKNSSINDYF